MNKRVVWFFEVKSNDGICRGAVGGENIAKLLHRADESKGVEIVRYASGPVIGEYRTYSTYLTYSAE